MQYFETSAKLGKNINECMQFLMSEVWKNLKENGNIIGRETITVNKNQTKEKKGGCC